MMTFLRWLARRIDRRPSPIGRLVHADRLGVHIAVATRAAGISELTFIRR